MLLPTHSVSLDAGESGGSGESTSSLREETKRQVSNYVSRVTMSCNGHTELSAPAEFEHY